MRTVPLLVCADCGAPAERRSPTQRYCTTCSGRRDTERKAEWARRHGHAVRSPEADRKRRSTIAAAGAERSIESRASIAWDTDEPIDAHTVVRVAVPFDWAASKNAIWRHGRGGHVYARQESVAMRALLAQQIRAAGGHWVQGKVWLDIFVEKPNHRGDAVNVIDLVCDAAKDAIGVDDRWYSIARLDWAIVKDNPRLIVGLRQAVHEDQQICSHCGRSLALNAEEFGRNRSMKTGFARVCRDCSAPKRGRKVAAC